MAEKLKEILGKILAWWNKFTSKQKTIIIAITAIVIFTFVILIYVFTKPNYTKLGTYESSATAAEIVEILDAAGITHQESTDARTIEVLEDQIAQANLAIASEGYLPDDLKYSDFVEVGMGTTSADRKNQYQDYVEAKIKNMFMKATPIKDVSIQLNLVDNTGRLSEMKQESYAYIQLTVTEEFNEANAAAIARAAATCIGNETTANITVIDQNMNILFTGGDDYNSMGAADSVQELQSRAEAMVANQIRKVIYGTQQYDMIEVSSHLYVDYSSYSKRITEYYAGEGRENGMKSHEDIASGENSGGTGGLPGTDSNGEDLTGYLNPDYSGGESSYNESSIDYQNNVSDSQITSPAGTIDYTASSTSVSMIKYRDYYEENVKSQGLLDGTDWETFKENNRESIRREVDEEYYKMVANASGISQENVTIIAYEVPRFFDREGLGVSGTDILSIVMIVLILALLGFVILRSMGPRKKAVEQQEELSVENMLQSMPAESGVEDIDLETKSETRKMVEKFVDENPEAAANLLRNWLNEDWN